MTSVDSILNYDRTEEEDYYGILGCDETATVSYQRRWSFMFSLRLFILHIPKAWIHLCIDLQPYVL
jgi:hypothetical protein